MTDEQRQALLDAHNKFRGMTSNPPAKDMPALVWDYKIEALAQAYIDKCPGMVHSKDLVYPVKQTNKYDYSLH